MMERITRLLVLLAIVLLATEARADLIDAANTLRTTGCGGHSASNPLKRNAQLDAVAREWSRGGRLVDALTRADYRATNSTSMHISGSREESAIMSVLRRNYCRQITEADFAEIGMFRDRDHVWLVLATPFEAPATQDAETVRARVLELVNQARAKDRKCGRTPFRAVPPLTGSAALDKAALAHAGDMAANDRFDHEGTDGSTPANRVERQGYRWATVAENIAVGATTPEQVVQGWLDSPGHCANIMGGQFSQMGVAYVVKRDSKGGIYWAQVFATPRS